MHGSDVPHFHCDDPCAKLRTSPTDPPWDAIRETATPPLRDFAAAFTLAPDLGID
jgi:hypothetical protein